MIVARTSSRRLAGSVRRAARPDEDVVLGRLASDALLRGFPRAAVLDGATTGAAAEEPRQAAIPVLVLDGRLLRRWEEERRAGGPDVPPDPTGYEAFRIGVWLERRGSRPSWVDHCLRDLGRAAGQPLPAPFRGMARRVLEHPSRYSDLGSLGTIAGLSPGALKARFRRRGLESPYTYLRWLRCLAVGEILSDPSVTTLEAAHRVGVSSSGNLSRTVQGITGMTPTRLRSESGRQRMLVGMVEELMAPSALAAWDDLDRVFLVAA